MSSWFKDTMTKDKMKKLTISRQMEICIAEVKEFCYLGDLLDCEGGVDRSMRMRVAAAWRKWREILSLLINRGIPLRQRPDF